MLISKYGLLGGIYSSGTDRQRVVLFGSVSYMSFLASGTASTRGLKCLIFFGSEPLMLLYSALREKEKMLIQRLWYAGSECGKSYEKGKRLGKELPFPPVSPSILRHLHSNEFRTEGERRKRREEKGPVFFSGK